MINNRNNNSNRTFPTRSSIRSSTNQSVNTFEKSSASANDDFSNKQTNQIIIAQSPKSVGIGIVLALLFGSIGLFYATISGGIIMLVIGAILNGIGLLMMGVGLSISIPLTNIISAIWSYISINRYNDEMMSNIIGQIY